MDEKANKIASLANAIAYNSGLTRHYIDGAPHIKHTALRHLYARLALDVYNRAAKNNPVPTVLDLGAGEGSVTLTFLELGAKVTAVDVSSSQLEALKAKCGDFADRLEICCEDVFDAVRSMKDEQKRYDIVVSSSFLHHVPDYLSFIRDIIDSISADGQFFSFQDPLWYDRLSVFDGTFTKLAYFSWRLFKGDVIGGIKRRVRRSRGIYKEDSQEDNVEYHVIRNGVDEDAIRELFIRKGFECEIIRYFSTQSAIWQPIGTMLGVKNIFAVLARRKCHSIC